MDEIKILHKSTFLGKEIDVWGTFDNPLFRASDVADWLHNTNVSNMVKKVDEDEVTKFNLGSRQGETLFLTENGLYEILMLSRKKEAKQFKKGVKAILHEIRTKGGYIASSVNDTPEAIMARALKIADETLKRNEQRVRELEAQTEQQAQVFKLVFDNGFSYHGSEPFKGDAKKYADTAIRIAEKIGYLWFSWRMGFTLNNLLNVRVVYGKNESYSEISNT